MTDPRQRTRSQASTDDLAMSGERDRVLARRRLALIGLAVAVPVTLGAAIFTGSIMFLVINLPGSVAGVTESLGVVGPALAHAVELLSDMPSPH